MTSKHDKIAETIARVLNAPYNKGKGADIRTTNRVVEVETESGGLSQGIGQLTGYRRPRYLAVPDDLVQQTIDRTRNTKIGVMDEHGRVRKRAG